jgi:hypothetical protein
MPFGGLLSLAPAALSVGSSLFGMANGTPASNVQGYNYQFRPQADQNAYGGINQLSQLGNMGVGAAQNVQNNPYAQQYVQNSQNIGQQGMQAGQQLTGNSLSMLPDVQALLSLGFDPQNALYSKLQNQNQQQNAAILGQSGVASTPYGAGVAADANSNFNINWQNQQLQRALQGAQGASGLMSNISGNVGTGLGLQQQGAALPYSAYGGTQTDALSALSQASGLGQTASNDWLSYLSGGQGQQGQNLSQANSSFSQSQALGAGLGQGLAGLSSGLGKMNLGWGSGSPFNITGSLY